MGWVDRLNGGTVGLNSAPLIYYIEENPAYLSTIDPFFDAMLRGDFQVVTSCVTLTEVLVHPIRRNDPELTAAYREILLNAAHLKTLPVSAEIAETAARLRAVHNIRTPDAIQAATAVVARADFFLTNDAKLSALRDPAVLVLAELAR